MADIEQSNQEKSPAAPLRQETRAIEHEVETKIADARITAEIQAALYTLPLERGLHVDVDTARGVVHLRGEVASPEAKAEAERLARSSCPAGVRRIVNQIRVNPNVPPLPRG